MTSHKKGSGGNMRTQMIFKTYDAYQNAEGMKDWLTAAHRLKRLEGLLENVKIPPVPANDGIYPSELIELRHYCDAHGYVITQAMSRWLKEHANDRDDFIFDTSGDSDKNGSDGGLEL